MADRLRVVQFPYRGGPPTVKLDVNDGTTFSLIRDSFKVTPAEKQQQFSQLVRRFGGQKMTQETHNNGQVEAEWYIGDGTTTTSAIQKQEQFLTLLETVSGQPYYLEWRPENVTSSVFYEIRANLPYEPMYRWIETSGTKRLHLKAAVSVAPLANGSPMFTRDDFLTNNAADWTQRAGGSGQSISHFTVGSNSWYAGSSAVIGATYMFTNERNGYTIDDSEQTLRFQVGSTTLTNVAFYLYFRFQPDHGGAFLPSFIRVVVDDDGTNSRLRIDKQIDGTTTNLASTNLTRMALLGKYWVRGRVEGNVVYAEFYSGTAMPGSATATTTLTHQLSSSDAALVGSGIKGDVGAGMVVRNNGGTPNSDAFLSWECRPYTYRNNAATGTSNVILPEEFKLVGVPGNAPALCDVTIRQSPGATAAGIFALLGWTPTPTPRNLVINGDFDDDYDGWTGSTIASVTTAASSITANSSAAHYGPLGFQITTAATTNSGAAYTIYGRFKRGQVYTLKAWCNTTAAKPMSLGVSRAGGTDLAHVTWTGTGWTERTATFIPTADDNVVYVFLRQTDATGGGTHYMDEVRLYEGTVEPTIQSQQNGRGAFPTFGIIEAEQDDASARSGGSVAITTDTDARSGSVLYWQQTAGASSMQTEYFVDPNLLVPDDYTEDEIQVEVWARLAISYNNAPSRWVASCFPVGGAGTERFTPEYGTVGKLVPAVSTATEAWRFVRFGTLTFRVDTARPGRWKLKVQQQWTSNSVGGSSNSLDYLILVPALKRANSPTGKAYNAASYPRFFGSTADITKVVNTDLSGEYQRFVGPDQQMSYPDHGLGGTFIEAPAGDSRFVVKLSSLVPDDPTVDDDIEQEEHYVGVTFDLTPRWFLLRDT